MTGSREMEPSTWRRTAPVAGALYLVIIVTALFAEIGVRGGLIVSRDAAATALNIQHAEPLFRLAGIADLVTFCCDVVLSALLYVLLTSSGRTVALAAAFFRLVYSAIIASASAWMFAPFIILKGTGLDAFTVQQRQALSMLALKMHSLSYNVALVFFGVHIMLVGWLVARSRSLPTPLGWLLEFAGGCYLVNSVVNLVQPGLSFFPYILLPGFVSEVGLALCLLAVGLRPAGSGEAQGD